ncbi:hypothetical protein N9H39_03835 [Gammaproteobacteria bacterium]|nr:hypothetical protein [Gammaproteobacteria bacterium]
MTSVKEIRAAIDAGLDKLQVKAEAAAAQLNLSEDEIKARLAEQEAKLKDAAEQLQTKLADSIDDETKLKIQSTVEQLQVQLALGAAEGRDAFDAKKKEITRAIAEFNAELDAADATEQRERAAEFEAAVQAYAAQAAALEAELEAMDEQYEKREGA